MGAELVHFLLESRDVGREKLVRQAEALDARVVAVKPALEIAGHRGQAAALARLHPDRVQLERRHPVVMHELPELRQVLHQRRDDLLRRADVGERIGHHEGLEPGQRLEGDRRHVGFRQILDVHAAAMGQRHCRGAIPGVVGDREIDLVLGGNAGLEGDAVRLGRGIAVAVLGEIEPLLLGQRLVQRPRRADEPGLALLANPAPEHRLDEDQPMPVDQGLDLVL